MFKYCLFSSKDIVMNSSLSGDLHNFNGQIHFFCDISVVFDVYNHTILNTKQRERLGF